MVLRDQKPSHRLLLTAIGLSEFGLINIIEARLRARTIPTTT
jgi:hypothetical protein